MKFLVQISSWLNLKKVQQYCQRSGVAVVHVVMKKADLSMADIDIPQAGINHTLRTLLVIIHMLITAIHMQGIRHITHPIHIYIKMKMGSMKVQTYMKGN